MPEPIVTLNEESLKTDLRELVRRTVEDTLNGLLEEDAARVVWDGHADTLTYTRFPRERWRHIRTNNAIERLNREIRRRTSVVGIFPDGKSVLMLVTARLKCVAESEWGSRRYLDVTLLDEWPCWRAGLWAVGKCARILTVPMKWLRRS